MVKKKSKQKKIVSSGKEYTSSVLLNTLILSIEGVVAIFAGLALIGISSITSSATFYAIFNAPSSLSPGLLSGVLTATALIAFILGIISLGTAYSVWHKKQWARIVGTILAIIQLISVPVGTVLGLVLLYCFWADKEGKKAYK